MTGIEIVGLAESVEIGLEGLAGHVPRVDLGQLDLRVGCQPAGEYVVTVRVDGNLDLVEHESLPAFVGVDIGQVQVHRCAALGGLLLERLVILRQFLDGDTAEPTRGVQPHPLGVVGEVGQGHGAGEAEQAAPDGDVPRGVGQVDRNVGVVVGVRSPDRDRHFPGAVTAQVEDVPRAVLRSDPYVKLSNPEDVEPGV